MSAPTYPLDPGNRDQATEWNGDDGRYWASHHEVFERMLGVFDAPLVDAAHVGPEDRCLDVGCGTGPTTHVLARASSGSVLGLDISEPLLTIARETAESAGIENVTFAQGDAQVYPFELASFDVAVSRMGCMFFADPSAAFTNIGQALRPGGRLAVTVWQRESDNGWITAIDSVLGEPPTSEEPVGSESTATYEPGPFSMADPALCRFLLDQAGFVDIAVEALDVPLAFGTVKEAQAYFETWMDEDLDSEARREVITSLHRLLNDNLTDRGVLLPSATWLISGHRPPMS